MLSFVPVPKASHHHAQLADSLHLYFFHPSRSYLLLNIQLNNLDFEEQKGSILLDNFISESEGSKIRVRISKADKPSPSTRRPRNSNTRRPTKRSRVTRKPTRRPRGRNTRRPTPRPSHSSNDRHIRHLLNVDWHHNECVGRTRDLSNICRDLKELVCERVQRLGGPAKQAKARFVCEKVGLRSSYESSDSEEEFDYWFASAAKAQADKPSTTPGTTGNVTYNVFMNSCPQSTEEQQGDFHGASTLMQPQAQDIGFCQNHGKGKSAYNSIEVLGCTDRCLW